VVGLNPKDHADLSLLCVFRIYQWTFRKAEHDELYWKEASFLRLIEREKIKKIPWVLAPSVLSALLGSFKETKKKKAGQV